mmetsp:Transcript_71508/g.205135  ORF Transcript_71508/g.205135 Transcript_71508/m.205135 type:complete len:230 (-) Transcript_71508:1368-2057(-)
MDDADAASTQSDGRSLQLHTSSLAYGGSAGRPSSPLLFLRRGGCIQTLLSALQALTLPVLLPQGPADLERRLEPVVRVWHALRDCGEDVLFNFVSQIAGIAHLGHLAHFLLHYVFPPAVLGIFEHPLGQPIVQYSAGSDQHWVVRVDACAQCNVEQASENGMPLTLFGLAQASFRPKLASIVCNGFQILQRIVLSRKLERRSKLCKLALVFVRWLPFVCIGSDELEDSP